MFNLKINFKKAACLATMFAGLVAPMDFNLEDNESFLFGETHLIAPEENKNNSDIENEKVIGVLLVSLLREYEKEGIAPSGIKVKTLIIHEGNLILNLSKEAFAMGKDYYEEELRNKVAKALLGLEEIKSVTMLVSNNNYYRLETL